MHRTSWMRVWLGACAALCLPVPSFALDLSGQVRIHDPSRIHKEGSRYYTFGTGFSFNGNSAPVISKYSNNLTHWEDGPAVFDGIPDWADEEVPDNPNFMWAPDVFYHDGEYRLYYSVSSWGSQNSVIGLATNATLNFDSRGYEWVDQGMVIESETGAAPYNAIDAGVFYDDATSRMWLTFGSHWNGIYITELDPETGLILSPRAPATNIARNPGSPVNAIEAPFLMGHDGRYYLFVNWDSCCQGEDSTYKIRVGRSDSPIGPFVDRSGVPMTSGGGELFLATEGDEIGPGHFSDFHEDGVNYFSYHYYDGDDRGRSKLGIREFVWTLDGWPVLADDLPPGDYNYDGLVDAADFAVWRDTLGLSGNGLPADGDGSGVIDAADYQIWNANFGAGAPLAGPHATPEPAAAVLALLGTLAVLARRRPG